MDIVPEQKWCTSTFHCAYKQVRPLCLSLVAVGFRVGVLFVDHKGLTSESHGKAWLGFTIQRVLSGLHSGHPRHSHAMLSKIRGEVVPRMQPKVLRIRGYGPHLFLGPMLELLGVIHSDTLYSTRDPCRLRQPLRSGGARNHCPKAMESLRHGKGHGVETFGAKLGNTWSVSRIEMYMMYFAFESLTAKNLD